MGWLMKKNNISIVLVSKGKDPSKHIDLNLNLIKFFLSFIVFILFFSASSLYIHFFHGNIFYNNIHVAPLNAEVDAIYDEEEEIAEAPSEPKEKAQYVDVLQLDLPIFEFEENSSALSSPNGEMDEEITIKLIEVEKKLIDMQELLKKKGIKKKLSIGGEYIPPERLSEEYLDAIDKDIENLSKVFRNYPIGKPIGGLISSNYGYRIDPFKKRRAFHSGIDFNSGYGSLVKSTAEGVVEKAGWYKGYGKCVVIKHSSGYKTLYGHLSKISVKRGQKVVSGDIIGKVGSTGRSTGPHLHYEIIKNGKRINPKKYLTMG